MQKYVETVFHIVYLFTVIRLGFALFKNKEDRFYSGFGWMALLLGFGDSFHLLPRINALWSGGFEAHAVSLGVGKFITSITMTFFYLIFYDLMKPKGTAKSLDHTMIVLAGIRIALCLFPQNAWLQANQPLLWGILRNLPFAVMGILMIYLLWKQGEKGLGTAVFLSFLFYLPVVLFADKYPLVGMLMIPKTLAYVYIVYWAYSRMKARSSKKNGDQIASNLPLSL